MKEKLHKLKFCLLFIIVLLIKPTMVFAVCNDIYTTQVVTSYTRDQTLTFNQIRAGMPITSWSTGPNAHFNNCTYGVGTWVTWSVRGLNYSGKEVVMDGKSYSVYSISARNSNSGTIDNDLFGVILEYVGNIQYTALNNNNIGWGTPLRLQSSGGFGMGVRARIISLKDVPNGNWVVGETYGQLTDGISYRCTSNIVSSCVSENASMVSLSILPKLNVLIKMQTCKVNYNNLINLPKVSFIDFNRASGTRVGTTPFVLGFDCAASSGGSYPIKVGISFQDANEILSDGNTLRNVAVNASNVKLALYSQPQEELKLNTKVPLFEYQSTAAAQFTKNFYVSYISTAAKTTPGAVQSTLIFNVTYD